MSTRSLLVARLVTLGLTLALAPACSPKPQTTPSDETPADSGNTKPPQGACDDDHACAAGQVCKRDPGASSGACVQGCIQGRDSHAVGDSFPSADGCNTCSCTESGVACTKKACACDPAREQHRQYKLKDPNECKVAFFQCPVGAKPFFNDCGCGCEQPASCPPSFNCMPGPGSVPCDAEAIKKQCPLSIIAY